MSSRKYAAVKSRMRKTLTRKRLNASRLARMKSRLAIHLAYGQFDLTSSFARYFEYFRLSSPGRHFAIQKNMWTTVRGRTFESHQFKMLAIFHSTRKIYPPRITTNIPLNPLMPAILLDNPSFARRLMCYAALDQSCIIARYINLLPYRPG